MSVYAYNGPRRGTAGAVDRAVLLAHGAGSDKESAVLKGVAGALAAAGVPSLRFDYPYRVAKKRAPDRPAVLERATRDAAAELAKRSGLPAGRLVLGGRSMGGRYCSQVVGDEELPVPALGLLLLGYPLHPAGQPSRLRVDHFPRLRVPCLFVSGTRDAMAGREALTKATKTIKGELLFHWLDSADHGYRPLKASGRTVDDVISEVAEVSVDWVTALPG
ncbi:MAG: alpha/beta hydrolase family protein [Acidimicrobiia bacterium]